MATLYTDAHHAIWGGRMQRWARAGRLRGRDLLSTLLLCTGLLIILQFLLLKVGGEYWQSETLRTKSTVQIHMKDGVGDAQIHALLQRLINVPHVRAVELWTKEQAFNHALTILPSFTDTEDNPAHNPFSDSVAVTIVSPLGFEVLLALVKRADVQALLQPDASLKIAERRAEVYAKLRSHRTAQSSLLFLSVLIILLLLLVSLQAVLERAYIRGDAVRLAEIAGADVWFLQQPFFLELLVLFLVALFLSAFLSAGAVLLSVPGIVTFPSLRTSAPWVLVFEVLSLTTLAYSATLPFLWRSVVPVRYTSY